MSYKVQDLVTSSRQCSFLTFSRLVGVNICTVDHSVPHGKEKKGERRERKN